MKVLYVPVFRVAISYAVTLGRRWSLLDHMLLVELATERRSLAELATAADLPERLVIEALINLLRAGWIEVRSTPDRAVFTATATGKRRAIERELPPELRRELKWVSLCMDRLAGCWLRSDDLDLIYLNELPEDAIKLAEIVTTLNYDDPDVRELIHLNSDEGFEGFQPAAKTPSRPFARVVVAHGAVVKGLPPGAPLRMAEAVLEAAASHPESEHAGESGSLSSETDRDVARDDLQPADVILGGPEHLVLLRGCLKAAKSHVIVHSCFLSPDTIRLLAPDLERAACRGVRVDLLWGLRDDPEKPDRLKPLRDSVAQLEAFDTPARDRVQISRLSSNSHCKVIVYDDSETGTWTSVVGSCNFLSSDFDWIELSVRVRSQRIASRLLGHLIAAQIPASGTWSAVARRLERTWSLVRLNAARQPEQGTHRLDLLVDTDHYAAITRARDKASADIAVGCDLFGIAAETSVLVPLERAAQLGVPSDLYYHRVTKFLEEKGAVPDPEMLASRGLSLRTVPTLHAKFLAWDHDNLAVTSFNWLSTVVTGSRNRGAELGLMVSGPGIRQVLADRLKIASKGKIDVGLKCGLPPSPTAEDRSQASSVDQERFEP